MNIKSFGLKNTKAREGIIDLLKKTRMPLDANSTRKMLFDKGINVDQATVYRALDTFVKKDIIKEVHLNDGVVRYEISNKPEHHHVVCVKCNRIEDIMDCSVEKIEKQIEKKKDFTVVSHSLEFFGICRNCRSNKS